jgi:hypothetical protein
VYFYVWCLLTSQKKKKRDKKIVHVQTAGGDIMLGTKTFRWRKRSTQLLLGSSDERKITVCMFSWRTVVFRDSTGKSGQTRRQLCLGVVGTETSPGFLFTIFFGAVGEKGFARDVYNITD